MKSKETGVLSRVIRFLGPSMIIGFVVGSGYALLANRFDWNTRVIDEAINLDVINLSASVALFIAVIYIGGGLMTGYAVVFPQRAYRALALESADEVIEQRAFYTFQSLSSTAFGLGLGLVVLAVPLGLIDPTPAFGGFVLLIAFGIYTYARSWRLMDELLRTASNEAITMGYYLVVLIGGTWSVLGHLGLTAGPALLDWIAILWSMILIAGFWASYRRGLLEGAV